MIVCDCLGESGSCESEEAVRGVEVSPHQIELLLKASARLRATTYAPSELNVPFQAPGSVNAITFFSVVSSTFGLRLLVSRPAGPRAKRIDAARVPRSRVATSGAHWWY